MQSQCMADCHSHTNNSPDGVNTTAEMCGRAAEIGLSYYTVTDHCECNDYLGRDYGFNYKEGLKRSFEDLKKNEELFKSSPRLLKGVELGQPLQGLEAAGEVIERHYDFVLGSVHNITGYEDFYFLNYENVTENYIDKLLTEYFNELLETIGWGRFNSLAHLTYPLRYITGDHGYRVDINRYSGPIENIFKALIQREIALEVNTSGLRGSLRATLPDRGLLEKYRSCGGRLLTIGSDAHKRDDLGKGIKEGLKIIYSAGFREYAVYINRSPLMIPII